MKTVDLVVEAIVKAMQKNDNVQAMTLEDIAEEMNIEKTAENFDCLLKILHRAEENGLIKHEYGRFWNIVERYVPDDPTVLQVLSCIGMFPAALCIAAHDLGITVQCLREILQSGLSTPGVYVLPLPDRFLVIDQRELDEITGAKDERFSC